jgi:hypothetical protein
LSFLSQLPAFRLKLLRVEASDLSSVRAGRVTTDEKCAAGFVVLGIPQLHESRIELRISGKLTQILEFPPAFLILAAGCKN